MQKQQLKKPSHKSLTVFVSSIVVLGVPIWAQILTLLPLAEDVRIPSNYSSTILDSFLALFILLTKSFGFGTIPCQPDSSTNLTKNS